MKRFTTLALALALTLGIAVSAQAVSLNFSDGNTANSTLGKISGLKFVNSQSEISRVLSENASTRFDLSLIASASDYTNTLGTGNKSTNYKQFAYNHSYDKKTGAYTGGDNKIKEDLLLGDIAFNIYHKGTTNQVYKIGGTKVQYGGRDRWDDLYETKTYDEPGKYQFNYLAWPKLQMFIVTDDSIEINGNVYYQGSIIFALDDGDHKHVDFNDLIFAMGVKTPPAVPIPGVAFLLAPGLIGLGVLRRKIK